MKLVTKIQTFSQLVTDLQSSLCLAVVIISCYYKAKYNKIPTIPTTITITTCIFSEHLTLLDHAIARENLSVWLSVLLSHSSVLSR